MGLSVGYTAPYQVQTNIPDRVTRLEAYVRQLQNANVSLLKVINNLVLPYKSVVLTMSQTSTSAPVIVNLSPDVSDIVATRNFAGNYHFTKAGAFPSGKVWIAGLGDYVGSANPHIPISDGVSIIGYITLFRDTDNRLEMEVWNPSWDNVDLGTLLEGTTIHLPEIRIYP